MHEYAKTGLLTFLISLIFLCQCQNDPRVLEYNSSIKVNEDTLAVMDQLLHQGVRDSAYPGFVFLGARDNNVFYYEAGGNFTYDNNSREMSKTAIFDMASVTKVVATTSAAMLLYDEGKLNLTQKVANVIPEFAAGGKEEVTFFHLLTHSSGLPAWNALFQGTDNPAGMLKKLYNLEQEQPEEEKMVYSCMGFVTIAKAVERITGKPLDQFLQQRLFEPLGMDHTFFNPPSEYLYRIPPTEYDSLRGGIVHGKVHDENAYYLGGVSGNAGLFSTAEDLAIFCQMMLNKGHYNGVKIFNPETVELFTKRQDINGNTSRALGWGKPTGQNSAGQYFSESSYGHTGYTGTALWIDPEKQLFGIFLTNRVHPTRQNQKLYRFRSKVFDKLQQSISN